MKGSDQRHSRRVAAQTPATIWCEGMSQPMNCTMRDRSPSGALLEFPADRFNLGITEIVIGDRVTLTFASSQERTSVACLVMRVDGRRCGVKFAGQFNTQALKTRKPSKPAVVAEAGAKPRATQRAEAPQKVAQPKAKSGFKLFR